MFAVLFANIKPETKARVAYMRPLHELLCVAGKKRKEIKLYCLLLWMEKGASWASVTMSEESQREQTSKEEKRGDGVGEKRVRKKE